MNLAFGTVDKISCFLIISSPEGRATQSRHYLETAVLPEFVTEELSLYFCTEELEVRIPYSSPFSLQW
jgi:hypothetical protein